MSPRSAPHPMHGEPDAQARLRELESILQALQSGEADAIVVHRADGDKVFTLTGAEESYRILLEQLNEGAASLSASGAVLYANARLARMLGVGTGQLLGTTFTAWIDPSDVPRFDDLVAQREGDARREMHLARADGVGVPVLVSVARLPRGQPGALALVVTDLTDEKRAQASMLHHERLRVLGTLVAGVAHEINNPLMYVRGSIDLVHLSAKELAQKMGPDAAPVLASIDEDVAMALRGVDRIATITRSLRQLARAPGGERTPEDVSSIVADALPAAQPRTPPHVSFVTSLDSHAKVLCNSGELAQVLLNLILNGLEAMGERRGTIRLATRDEGADVVIEVADEGPGIPQEVQQKLFTPFFTTKPHGTGLGLSVSQSIVESHGGTLTFETARGHGTTFRVRLPAASASA